jgi:hypothetical protein
VCALSAAAGTPPSGCCETWAASMRPGVVAVCCQPCCFQSSGRGKLPSLLLIKVNIKVNIVNACCVDDCQMLPCASHAAATRLRFGRVGTSLLLHQQVHTQSTAVTVHTASACITQGSLRLQQGPSEIIGCTMCGLLWRPADPHQMATVCQAQTD